MKPEFGGRGRGGKPSSTSWRERAAPDAPLSPGPSPVLTASEIGSFAFCPQAWYLQRCAVSRAPDAELRLAAGSDRHRAIGRRADLVRTAGAVQRLVLAAIVVLAVLLLLALARGTP